MWHSSRSGARALASCPSRALKVGVVFTKPCCATLVKRAVKSANGRCQQAALTNEAADLFDDSAVRTSCCRRPSVNSLGLLFAISWLLSIEYGTRLSFRRPPQNCCRMQAISRRISASDADRTTHTSAFSLFSAKAFG